MGRTVTSVQPAPAPRKVWKESERPVGDSHRDTVEAFVVAFILALVARGFQVQAFVIPTGSMAPTLMGRHKEITCPQCGHVYTVNASHEVEGESPVAVYSGICTNCRFQARGLTSQQSFKGDRILVMMFPYDLPFLPGASPPSRWDVVVFRYPEEPEVSYIKRLVGLPGETIRIKQGDVYVRKPDSTDFRRERKPLRHQRAMQIIVHDDRHRPKALAGNDLWQRWRQDTGTGWKSVAANQSRYLCEASAGDDWSVLTYKHLVPDPEQWEAAISEHPLPHPPRPTLITDFYSYNTNMSKNYSDLLDEPGMARHAWMQPHWVGDLTLEADLEVTSATGEVRLELIKGGTPYRCTLDLATGTARFQRGEEPLGEAATPIRGPGRHAVEFANVDDRLSLMVDGRAIEAAGVEYDREDTPLAPTVEDLSPVRIAVRHAAVGVSNLVLKRDIYYTQTPGENDYRAVFGRQSIRTPTQLFDFLADATQFPSFSRQETHEYVLGADRFLMLGDNSPQSKDSRGWGMADSEWDSMSHRAAWEVPRSLITGKAFFVYWPHGVPLWPEIPVLDARIPFRPYVERMRWIR